MLPKKNTTGSAVDIGANLPDPPDLTIPEWLDERHNHQYGDALRRQDAFNREVLDILKQLSSSEKDDS